jgi:hypothetical protein
MKTTTKNSTRPAPSGAKDAGLERVIQVTLPSQADQHEKAVFNFARGLKGISRYAGKPLSDLKGLVQKWHERAGAVLDSILFEDTWARFVESWHAAKHPLTPLDFAIYDAEHEPDPVEAMQYKDPRKRKLLKVCRSLQINQGNGNFYLDSESAGEIVGTDKKTAWKWLQMFVVTEFWLWSKKAGERKAEALWRPRIGI